MPESTRPPGPKGSLITGSLNEFHEAPLRFLEDNARLYGDVVGFRFFHMPAVQLNHPDDVRQVFMNAEGAFVKGMAQESFRPLVGKGLLLNEGEPHKRQRRMMAPAFHRQRVMGYAEVMLEEAARARDAWAESPDGLDLADALNRLTLRIAARTLFGADLSLAESDEVAAAVAAFAQWYHQTSHPLGPLLQLLPSATNRRFHDGKRRLSAVVSRMITARRLSGDTGDILSMLVFARDEEGDGAAMSDEHIHDEVTTLLVAGHETTAATLAWAFWLLAAHPEVTARLQAQLDEVLGDRPPQAADLPRLTLCDQVFAETLRLYPSAMALPRQAVKPVTFGAYTFAPGTLILAAAWCAHRDPRFWDEPLSFRPERFTAEASAGRPRFAYFPFGGGARVCIGEAFAKMEGSLLLATLLQRFTPERLSDTAPIPETLFTLRPKGGLPVRLQRRTLIRSE
ncbi:MAG: cytochrome P450 [Deltaproteobacteria bacterium]|nr:cytochrome P450 [Deltaproteobacteria bacterium]